MSTDTADRSPDSDVSPEPILQIAGGFMASKHLFAASELGIFEALAEGATDVDGLAARTGLTRRAARISADAMVALGLLERDGEAYRNTPPAATFLAGVTPADLRPFLRFWDRVSYPAWLGFADALAAGPSEQIFDLDDELQQVASEGIEAILTGPAMALARSGDFAGRRSLLDVG
ncbi:MAG: SAM-dependent methyltransferase, partial [Actinobacteria bacterium]|nr:SAM-dependent methyltransferase [Actinomycetota bacterium]